ncbi:hypothetical protein Aduo_015933 [Ancylostoma duodenale]
MSRLVALLLLIVAGCQAKRNSTEAPNFCIEYAECMAKANQKSAECLSENTTALAATGKRICEGAVELHLQLQALYDEKNQDVESCVREKATDALTLSPRKTDRCKTALKKTKRALSFDPAERRQKRKEKKERKEKPKSCSKEAKRMRWQCARIAKCCSVAKDCNADAIQREEIAEKKRELKKVYATCHGPEFKKKRLNRKEEKEEDDKAKEKKEKKEKTEKPDKKQKKEQKKTSKENDKSEESPVKKRAAPIKSKALEEVSELSIAS